MNLSESQCLSVQITKEYTILCQVGHNHVDHVMLIESESDRPSAVHHNGEQL